MRMILIAVSTLAFAATPAFAAPCRDAHGKFIKCADKAPAKAKRCKSANGKFAKCGTPGAKPM